MTRTFLFALAGGALLSTALTSCQSSNLEVGGVPGAFLNGRSITQTASEFSQPEGASVPDAAVLPTEREKGQVRFSKPILKHHIPSEEKYKKPFPQCPQPDPVPAAIDRAAGDYSRDYRIDQLVR